LFLLILPFFNKFKNIWGLGIGDWGLGIGALGVGPNPPTPNPQSPIPNPHCIKADKN